MTPEQKAKYLATGFRCPFCETLNIRTTTAIIAQDGDVWQDVECVLCKRMWQDTYKLAAVDELL